jgi:hypothetical protein
MARTPIEVRLGPFEVDGSIGAHMGGHEH